MIIPSNNRTVIGLQDFKSETFAIDQEDMGWISQILGAKLYSDKKKAVVREYSCNAQDAHADNGCPDLPISITVPTKDEPTLKIRDFGKGLSHEDISRVYIKYGKSTKRDSNSTTGCLGIGCKSAFSYTDSFNITSWHNGTCSRYTAQVDAQGRGILIPLSVEPSNDPTGIEIEVAVSESDVADFSQKIIDICKYFKVKPNIIGDLVIPELNKKIDGGFYFLTEFVQTSYYNRSQNVSNIIMGNVCYPVNAELVEGADSKERAILSMNNLYFNAEMGEVDFAPDREKLEYTRKTCQNLISLARRYMDNVRIIVQTNIDAASDFVSSIKVYSSTMATLGNPPYITPADFTYKGAKLVLSFEVKQFENLDKLKPFRLSYSCGEIKREKCGNYRNSMNVNMSDMHLTTILICDEDKFVRSKATRIFKENEGKIKQIYVMFKPTDGSELEAFNKYLESNGFNAHLKEYLRYSSTIEKYREARVSGGGYASRKRTFCTFECSSWISSDETLPDDKDKKLYLPLRFNKVVCPNGYEMTEDRINSIFERFLEAFPESKGIELYGIPVKDTKKLDNTWQNFFEYVKERVEDFIKNSYKREDHEILYLNSSSINHSVVTNSLSITELHVLDEVNKIVEIANKYGKAKTNRDLIITLGKISILANEINLGNASFIPHVSPINDLNNEVRLETWISRLLKKFPLLRVLDTYSIDNGLKDAIIQYVQMISTKA